MGSSSSTSRRADILRPPPGYVPETYSPPPAPPPPPHISSPTPPETETGPPIPPPHSTVPLPSGEAERVAPGFPAEHGGYGGSAAGGPPPPPSEYRHEEGGDEGEGESAKRLHAEVDSGGPDEGPLRKRRAREAQEAGVAPEETAFAALTADAHGGENNGANGAADGIPAGSTGDEVSALVDAVNGTVADDQGATDGGGAVAAAAAVAKAAVAPSLNAPSGFAPSPDVASTVATPALDPSSYHASFGGGFPTSAVAAVSMDTVAVSSADLSTPAVATVATTTTAQMDASAAMYSTMASMPEDLVVPPSSAGLDIASPPLDAPATGDHSHAPLAISSMGIGTAAPPPPPLSVSACDGISPELGAPGDRDTAPSPGRADGVLDPPLPPSAPPIQMPLSMPMQILMPMPSMLSMPSMPLQPISIAEAPQCETAAPAGMVPPAPYHHNFLPMLSQQLFHAGTAASTTALSQPAVGAVPVAGAAGSFGSTYTDSATAAMSPAASYMMPQPDSLALGGIENALVAQPLLSVFLAGAGAGGGEASGGARPGAPPAVAGDVSKASARRKTPASASGEKSRKIRNRPSCVTEGCKRRPLFGLEGTRQAQFCARHKEPNMVNVLCRRCEVDDCKHQPSFGAAGSRPMRCAGHKEEGMVNVSAPRCQHSGCQVCPSFGKHGEKRAMFCAAHRREGDIDLVTRRCHHEGCVRRPVFGHAPERKVYYCARHKLDGMVNVCAARCESPECAHQPSWGLPGTKRPTHCAKHRSQAHENKRGP